MSIAELLLPHTCATCGAGTRMPLCGHCAEAVDWIHPPLCAACGAPVAVSHAARDCRECRGRPPAFDRARAAALYRGPARDALMRFKLAGERRAARMLALAMVAAAMQAGGLGAPDVVTFVPSARDAERERGFNPAERLARFVATAAGVPIRPLLSKRGGVADLAALGRDARREALANAFVARPLATTPAHVVLVDDVYTTGATATACAAELKRAGAEHVDVLTFARTIRTYPGRHLPEGKPR